MSQHQQLADLLTSVGPDGPCVKAEFYDRVSPRPSLEVTIGPGGARPRWGALGPWPEPRERTRTLWFAPPNHYRVEVRRAAELEFVGVRQDLRWSRWNAEHGSSTGVAQFAEGVWLGPRLLDPPLLDPMRLLAWLRLDANGVGRRAGRDVRLAQGRPRMHSVATAALAYRLEFDAEYGTILRHEALKDGVTVQLTEGQSIAYPAVLPLELFLLAEPPGSVARAQERVAS